MANTNGASNDKLIRIKNRYGTDANWNSNSAVVLQGGEIGVSDSGDIILGNNEYNRKMSMIQHFSYYDDDSYDNNIDKRIEKLFRDCKYFPPSLIKLDTDRELLDMFNPVHGGNKPLNYPLSFTTHLEMSGFNYINNYECKIYNETITKDGYSYKKIGFLPDHDCKLRNFKSEDGMTIGYPEKSFYKEIHVYGRATYTWPDPDTQGATNTSDDVIFNTDSTCIKDAYIDQNEIIFYIKEIGDANANLSIEIDCIDIIPNMIHEDILYKGLNCVSMSSDGIDIYPIKANDSYVSESIDTFFIRKNKEIYVANSFSCKASCTKSSNTNYVDIKISLRDDNGIIINDGLNDFLLKFGNVNYAMELFTLYDLFECSIYIPDIVCANVKSISATVDENLNTIFEIKETIYNKTLYDNCPKNNVDAILYIHSNSNTPYTLDLNINGDHFPILNQPNKMIKINHPSSGQWEVNGFHAGYLEIHVPGFLPVYINEEDSKPLIEITNANTSNNITVENAEYGYFMYSITGENNYTLVYFNGTSNIGDLPVYAIPHYMYETKTATNF